ncbi:uncharacterized protein ARB_06597 [Trichophyton benhamiae CBS 112371]|uniref:Uncharacterized protein n=1 Tax=Arthroderma benhamiae (strain ATCC MYA-4681 / CBS 112371) TaxID=663331 RepID=D4AQT7_ARTBC|nr:uncharacterized protein ARB_06597 [Trichophyton benhamiae CBS 112371]EFE34831.1 hypothetical protein ARB_06597 [Trichophyton benhamiae CBS 112371]
MMKMGEEKKEERRTKKNLSQNPEEDEEDYWKRQAGPDLRLRNVAKGSKGLHLKKYLEDAEEVKLYWQIGYSKKGPKGEQQISKDDGKETPA